MNPIKPSIKTEAAPLAMILFTIIFSAYFYPMLPDMIASHWNFSGAVDSYTNKAFMVWVFPAMMLLMYASFLILPYIDPKKKNYEGFNGFYHFFKALMLAVLFLTFLGVEAYNLGYDINITLLSTVSLGVLMIIIGLFLKNIKPNWFLGIKNPWTLSSDNVWKKTHRIGGYFFIIFGLIIISCNFLPEILAAILFILGIILMILGTTIYSYIIYSKENKKHRK